MVRYLIDDMGMDAEIVDRRSTTPLFCAVESGSIGLVKYLIEEKRVNANQRSIKERLQCLV